MKHLNTTLLLILLATAATMVCNSFPQAADVFRSHHSSGHTPAAPKPTAAKPAFGPGEAIFQVRLYYQANLKDYGSARFDWGNFTGTELVFTLNAKNGFGGYTGPRRMVAIFVNGKLNRIAG